MISYSRTKVAANTGTSAVFPAEPLTEADAQKILERPDVQPADDGLFDGHSQTFRLRRNWREHFKYRT
jgi:hypothetical protein